MSAVADDTPVHLTGMVRAWKCRKRGLCCKHQFVQIDEVERRRLERHLRAANDPLAERLTHDDVRRESGWPVLPQVGERCAFLTEDNLCGVRVRFGDAAYPRVCKKFPYLSIMTDDRQVVGLTFQCPTALQLLAEETAFEVIVERGIEPPVQSVAWMGDAERECWDLQGERISVARFWAQHWELFERFAGRPEADPVARLVAWTEEITGETAPPAAELGPRHWMQGAFDDSLAAEVNRLAGEVPQGLPFLWTHSPPEEYTLDPLPPLDEAALLMRYLHHRLLVPVFYLAAASPRFLIATLFAMIARYRIERERGFDVLAAVRQLDRYFVHTANAPAIFQSQMIFPAWRAMASLARAVTVG